MGPPVLSPDSSLITLSATSSLRTRLLTPQALEQLTNDALRRKQAVDSMLFYPLLALAYVVTGRLGLLLSVPPGYATAIFPPAGIAAVDFPRVADPQLLDRL